MEHETDLVGERRTATGAIGGELRLVHLDQILGLAARAIQAVVDPLGRADIEAGNDEADVEAEHRRLDTGDGAPFAIPGLCLVARLGIAAQNSQVLDGAPRADVVSDLVDFSGERLGPGQTEDVGDAVVLAPRHRLRPSIVPVATERNSRLVPSRADVPNQASKMGTHLDAARRLAGPQHDRHGPALLRVIDVDRKEPAFVIMAVAGWPGTHHGRHGPALLRVIGVDRQEAAFVIMSVDRWPWTTSQVSSISRVMDAG